jgi:hypothetical protein
VIPNDTLAGTAALSSQKLAYDKKTIRTAGIKYEIKKN